MGMGWEVSTRNSAYNSIADSLDNLNDNSTLKDLYNSANVTELPTNTGRGNFDYAYAEDLVHFAPKHKFLFKVAFYFDTNYADIPNREFVYLVKSIDKPKIDFEYEEVNMYNYRTKVLKTIKQQLLSIEFIDDIQNKVMDFFNAYRTAYIPLANIQPSYRQLYETSGMNFNNRNMLSANSGQLRGTSHNVLRGITVCQIFGHGTKANYFHFVNPKVESFDFDGVDHEDGGTGNGMSVSFTYDSLYITHEANLNSTPLYAWGRKDLNGNNDSSGKDIFALPIPGQQNLGDNTQYNSYNSNENRQRGNMNDLVEERSNGWEVSTSGSSFNGGWSVSTSPMQDAFNRTKNIVDGNVKRKDIVALADDVTLEGYL